MSTTKSLADYLTVWFSNYAPVNKNLHIRLSFLFAFIFIYTSLSIQRFPSQTSSFFSSFYLLLSWRTTWSPTTIRTYPRDCW